MLDYAMANAIRQAATICKSEMESTSEPAKRRAIIDRHLEPLKVKFGVSKGILQVEIYRLTYDK